MNMRLEPKKEEETKNFGLAILTAMLWYIRKQTERECISVPPELQKGQKKGNIMKRRKFLPILLTISLLCLSAESDIHIMRTNAASVSADSTAGNSSAPEAALGTASPETSASQTPEGTSVPSLVPAETQTPSPHPPKTPKPTGAPRPTKTPKPTGTPKPTKTPKPVTLLKKVTNVKIKRYSTTAAEITWKKVKKAKYYHVYVSQAKKSGYRLKGVTQKTHFLAKKLKNHKNYYFYVKACKKKKRSATDSSPSAIVHIKTRTYSRKVVFGGDSITTGLAYYTKIPITGKVRVVAAIGLNTRSFCSRRVFNGRTGLQKTIQIKPYRAYLMLGMNGANFMQPNSLVGEYRHIIQRIKAESPNTDIVVCPVSPVT
ncbi:MAG: hypothetical protein IJ733_11740, partial [Lachnospiraceae bacterium]|nr:hypothetical protein [Lachnospiraceae bacterium]